MTVCGALAGIKVELLRSVIFHFNLRPVLTLFKTITIIHSQLTVEYILYNEQASKRRKEEEKEEKERRKGGRKKERKKLIRHY